MNKTYVVRMSIGGRIETRAIKSDNRLDAWMLAVKVAKALRSTPQDNIKILSVYKTEREG